MHDGEAETRHKLGQRSLSLFSVRGVSEDMKNGKCRWV